MSISSTNPALGQLVQTFQSLTEKEINTTLDNAVAAFQDWRKTSMEQREMLMTKAADELKMNKEKYASLITLEMGKPIKESLAEVEKCAFNCEYYAIHAAKFLAPEDYHIEGQKSYVRFDPLGVVLAIMPWNFPLWQVFRFAAPALMAGNTAVLKHASNVPQCALAIAEVFQKAGFPENVFQTLLIESKAVGKIIEDDRIAAVTLTGSEGAGKQVAEAAGRSLKKVVLELGGSDPFIVLADADLPKAAVNAVSSRTLNAGQSCISAKRFIVEKKVSEEFTKLFVQEMSKLQVGDPMESTTNIGPLAKEEFREELDRQVQDSVSKGAKVILGGKKLDGLGYYYTPTILTDVKKGMPAYDQELFGPVASIIVVENEQEAIQVANDNRYGLGANVWTKDVAKAEKLAAEIDSGAVFINGFVRSDPRLPFGGVKKSGYGRELSSYGIKEFTNIKTVVVKS